MSYTAPTITFLASGTPGLSGTPVGYASYTDLTILSSNSSAFSPSGPQIDAWCLDRNVTLLAGALAANGFYRANLYSTAAAELDILNTAMPLLAGGLAGLKQLDSVNWLLNSYYKGTLGSIGIWQNVQGAVWALVGQDSSATGQLIDGNQNAITFLTTQALKPVADGGGDGYVADQGQTQYVGIVADPRLVADVAIPLPLQTGQPLIIPVLAARLGDFVWLDANNNGLQDNNEMGVNGVTVTLFRDLNNSGSYDAGDLLLGTKQTGPNGYYEFNGLTPGLCLPGAVHAAQRLRLHHPQCQCQWQRHHRQRCQHRHWRCPTGHAGAG